MFRYGSGLQLESVSCRVEVRSGPRGMPPPMTPAALWIPMALIAGARRATAGIVSGGAERSSSSWRQPVLTPIRPCRGGRSTASPSLMLRAAARTPGPCHGHILVAGQPHRGADAWNWARQKCQRPGRLAAARSRSASKAPRPSRPPVAPARAGQDGGRLQRSVSVVGRQKVGVQVYVPVQLAGCRERCHLMDCRLFDPDREPGSSQRGRHRKPPCQRR